jgi:hypothetical protein
MAMLACTMVGTMTFWIVVAWSVGNALIPGSVLVALLAVASPTVLRLIRD